MGNIKTNDIRELKENYYNIVLKTPLKGGENVNAQYIIKM